MRLRLVVLSIGWLVLAATASAAADPTSGEVRLGSAPLAGSAEAEMDPAVAYNTMNQTYLVVWMQGNPNPEIWGQVVDDDGVPVSVPRRLSAAGEIGSRPAAAYNAYSNQYLVVWEQLYTDSPPADWDVWGQRVKANGTLVGDPIPIGFYTGDDFEVDVAANFLNGQYLVVWTHAEFGDAGIEAQRVMKNGALKGGAIWVASGGGLIHQTPAVAFNPIRRHYLVVWEDQRWGPDDPDIYGQRVRAVGVLKGPQIPIAVSTARQTAPDVGFSLWDDKYMVVWEDSQGNGNIYGQMVNPWGTLRFAERAIATRSTPETDPVIGANGAPGSGNIWAVVWVDWFYGIDDRDILGRYLNEKGKVVGAGPFVMAGSAQKEARPAVAPHQDLFNRWFVVWERYAPDADIWIGWTG